MRRSICVLIAIALCFIAGGTARGKEYEELGGRFLIDLPDGYQLAPQVSDDVFVFQKDDGTPAIILEYIHGRITQEECFERGVGTLKAAGFSSEQLYGSIMDYSSTMNKARLGVYRGSINGAGMLGFVGGVTVGDNGMYILAFRDENSYRVEESLLRKIFFSIRSPEQGKQNWGEGVKVTDEAGDALADRDLYDDSTYSTWKSEKVILQIPSFLAEKELNKSDIKEIKAHFEIKNHPGASFHVICYTGFGMWKGKVLDATQKVIRTFPDAELVDGYESDDEKMTTMVYDYTVVSGGQKHPSVLIFVYKEVKKCHLLLQGYAPASNREVLEKVMNETALNAE